MQRKIKPRQIVFSQNDKSKEMYYIQSGKVRIHQIKNKKEIPLATLTKGALFGEMAMIAGMHRTATAVAVEDSELTVITEDEFKSNTEHVPPWYMTLLRISCERLKQINEKLQISAGPIVTISNISRLMAMVIKKIQHDNNTAPDSISGPQRLDLKSVKREVIEVLGIGISTMNESLEFLKEKGMINILPNTIEIPDVETLFQYSFFLKSAASNQDFELMNEDLFALLQNLTDLLKQDYPSDQKASCTYSDFKSKTALKINLEEDKIEWFLNFCKTESLIKFIFSDTTEAANITSMDDNTQFQFNIAKLSHMVNEEKFKKMGL